MQWDKYGQQKDLKVKASPSAVVKNVRAKILGRRLWILGVESEGRRTIWEGEKETRADLIQKHSPGALGMAEKDLASYKLSTGGGGTGTKVWAM